MWWGVPLLWFILLCEDLGQGNIGKEHKLVPKQRGRTWAVYLPGAGPCLDFLL